MSRGSPIGSCEGVRNNRPVHLRIGCSLSRARHGTALRRMSREAVRRGSSPRAAGGDVR
ncbi:hypothetical protein GBP346_A0876 [Burkholderia pseudomallei MSHR346]|nr:hypothetical protein GBP346_A0876 [Burkholderia pseudomallei MSHR346]